MFLDGEEELSRTKNVYLWATGTLVEYASTSTYQGQG